MNPSGDPRYYRTVARVVWECLSAAAILFAIVVLWNRGRPQNLASAVAEIPRVSEDSLERWAENGIWEGPEQANVTIMSFTDYTCHFCFQQDSVLQLTMKRFPDHVSVITTHVPNPANELASRLALIARCAYGVHMFSRVHPHLYELAAMTRPDINIKQQLRAFVNDSVADQIQTCVEDSPPVAAVKDDIKAGEYLNLRINPVLIVNGRVMPGLTEFPALQAVVLAEMRQEKRDFLQKPRKIPQIKEKSK